MSTTHVVVKKAMVSSTARDLPDHRKQVMDACQRQTFFPMMMEHLPASDAEAISASMAMVDQAEIYIGVYAYRYGYVPAGHSISVTEMEYNRAVERKIPRLIFIMGKNHPVTIDDVEMGEAAEKLKVFKDKIGKENIVNFFSSPEELRSFVLNSLSQLPKDEGVEFRYHYVSDIPAPPEPYIAHPYVLSQAKGLIGRQAELNLLTDWFTGKNGLGGVRIFNVVAIGGMGKSALTWKWFNEIAPQQPCPLMAGRMWWSFYESDANFENFIIRALAYVGRISIEESQKMPPGQREEKLLSILDREPHLLVLDGLERILIAYARIDAAHFTDDDYDKQTANFIAKAQGLSESEKETFLDGRQLRKSADPRAGSFLRKLTQVRSSSVLISTRLYPYDLQIDTGDPLPGCHCFFIKGLSDDDALDLWQEFGISGTRDTLVPMFRTFGNYPLLLQSLAGAVARYRPAPGDFDAWRKAKPDFNPFNLDLIQAKTHVLQFALQGLGKEAREILSTIAAFRAPAQYDTLRALLCGKNKPCKDEDVLIQMLDELDDRGLVGWDRRANRYDLHPVVRGVSWNSVSKKDKTVIYSSLQTHFSAAPIINENEINDINDLTPAIELYFSLIEQGKFDDASVFFFERLSGALLFKLSAARQAIEILEPLIQDINSQEKTLSWNNYELFNCLGIAYIANGEPSKGCKVYKQLITSDSTDVNLLCNYSAALRQCGHLKEAFSSSFRAFESCSDIVENNKKLFGSSPYDEDLAVSMRWYGLTLATIGEYNTAEKYLTEALSIFIELENKKYEGSINALLAQLFLWQFKPTEAHDYATAAWQLANIKSDVRDLIRAANHQGKVALALENYPNASERLHYALISARSINYTEEELIALTALADLARQQGNPIEAREHLDDIREYAERGPYPLFHADALNVLCQIERDAGNNSAAIEAATQAYRLAWCDGPPYAYHYGLENAKKHLRELGAPEPEMPKTEHLAE